MFEKQKDEKEKSIFLASESYVIFSYMCMWDYERLSNSSLEF